MQLQTLSEGDSEPIDETVDINRISSLGNTSLSVQAGRNEILLGDQSLRQDNRWVSFQLWYNSKKKKIYKM